MPHLLRGQLTLQLDSLLPEDVIINTWYCDGNDADITTPSRTALTVAADFEAKLATFYQAIASEFPIEVVDSITTKWYDLADAEPRVPIRESSFAITPSGSAGLPHECAVVLSFRAEPASGQAPARRRGRVYLGPFQVNTLVTTASKVLVRNVTVAQIRDAAGVLQAANDDDSAWAVFSPATLAGGASLADSFHDVDNGWVDNAWDTQRRRGQDSTVRSIFPV